MTVKETIEKHLAFLVSDYGFTYKFETSNGNDMRFIYENANGYFMYYQWEQFGESEFSVCCNQTFLKVSLIEKYPHIFAQFRKNHRGIKWFFKDSRKDYWEMVSSILRNEIENNGSLFGLYIT